MSTATDFLLLLGRRRKSILSVLRSITGYLGVWPEQETPGDVAVADNVEVALGMYVIW